MIEDLVLSFFITLAFNGINAHLFIILLKGSKILTGFRELSFLHALTNVLVDKGTLGVHEIKLVIKSGPGFCNGSGVGQHADTPWYLS